jgi:hypothetical protein
VDEIKHIRDKAIAMEMYARLAGNFEAERQVRIVRLRAEQCMGKLLRKRKKAKGAAEPGTNRGATRSQHATASLADLGVSKS